MSDRPKGFGMTAEITDRINAKYDARLDEEARAWIAAITGGDIPSADGDASENMASFAETFKNGAILCQLINEIAPGSVKKINESKMAFKMMENIGKFLEACEHYGVAKGDLFQTVSLFEATNIPQVIDGIHALGRKAGSKGFSPAIGPKESAANKREFSEEQLKAGKDVIGLQMGSNKGASQAGMSYGKPRQIHDPTV